MVPAALTLAGVIFAVAVGFAGAKYARRKDNAEATKLLVDTALQLIDPLKIQVGVLEARMIVVESENARLVSSIAAVNADNRNLRSENAGLRARIDSLESQLRDLGHIPVNGAAGATVTTHTVTTTQQDAP